MRVMLRRLRLVTHMINIYVGLLIDWVGWGGFACCKAGEELFCFSLEYELSSYGTIKWQDCAEMRLCLVLDGDDDDLKAKKSHFTIERALRAIVNWCGF